MSSSPRSKQPDNPATLVQAYNEIFTENQRAAVVGWVGVSMTGMLLAVGFIGMWHLRRNVVT